MFEKFFEIIEKERDELFIILHKILILSSSNMGNFCFPPALSSYIKAHIENGFFKQIKIKYNFNLEKFLEDITKKHTINRLYRDKITWFLLLSAAYFNNKDRKEYLDNEIVFFLLFILIFKYYVALNYKYLPKTCNSDRVDLALHKVSKTCLFSPDNETVKREANEYINIVNDLQLKTQFRKSDITLGLIYIIKKVKEKYLDVLKDITDTSKYLNIILALRMRLVQSFKNLVRKYYEITLKEQESTEEKGYQVAVENIMNQNAQGYVYISDEYLKKISKETQIGLKQIRYLYRTAFQKAENFYNTRELIVIYLKDNRFEYLKNAKNIEDWIEVIKGLINTQEYNVRKVLLQILMTDQTIRNFFENKVESLKYKYIRALALVVAVVVFITFRGTKILNFLSKSFFQIASTTHA